MKNIYPFCHTFITYNPLILASCLTDMPKEAARGMLSGALNTITILFTGLFS